MFILRYLVRMTLSFIGGMVGFFVLLLTIALAIGVLLVGATCAMFMCWSVIHLGIFVATHDKQAETHAIQSILMAAGCFGALVVFWRVVGDLWGRLMRPTPKSEPFNEPLPELSLAQDSECVWHYDYAAARK